MRVFEDGCPALGFEVAKKQGLADKLKGVLGSGQEKTCREPDPEMRQEALTMKDCPGRFEEGDQRIKISRHNGDQSSWP